MRNVLKIIGAGALLSLLFVVPAPAQTLDHPVTFSAPFAFYAGNNKMPAGTYTISQSNLDPGILTVQDSSGKHEGFVDVNQAQAPTVHAKSEVTFNKYGTTEFLDSVWTGGQMLGAQAEPTKAEKAYMSKGAAQKHSVSAK
jgi:hypothetical protein